jgi:hypothetical protein
VTNNLDALPTALYVDLDDRVLPALGWSYDHRPGRKPVLSDAELACLAVAQHPLGIAALVAGSWLLVTSVTDVSPVSGVTPLQSSARRPARRLVNDGGGVEFRDSNYLP